MEDVKQQLHRFKKENNELEKELRGMFTFVSFSPIAEYQFGNVENVNIEQKARLLETRVVENAETIEQLRQERALLAADHKELQRRFAEASEVCYHKNIIHDHPKLLMLLAFQFRRLQTISATNMLHTRTLMIIVVTSWIYTDWKLTICVELLMSASQTCIEQKRRSRR